MQDAPTSRRPHLALAATVAAGTGAAVLLRLFPPQTSRIYPLCPIHSYTGLLCPGCGATRALAALAGGHPGEALRFNPLVVVALAGVAVFACIAYLRAVRGVQRPWPAVPPAAIAVALLSSLIFTVARNLR